MMILNEPDFLVKTLIKDVREDNKTKETPGKSKAVARDGIIYLRLSGS